MFEPVFFFHVKEKKNNFHFLKQEFVDMLNLKPGQKVLDVGCGIGGGDFYMAKVGGNKLGHHHVLKVIGLTRGLWHFFYFFLEFWS